MPRQPGLAVATPGVEAMVMGIPCVGSRAVGLEEIIVHGENGLLSESGNPPDPGLRLRHTR